MLRKIGAINFIEQFKYAALAITLPLYLISKGVDVAEIGLVLSLLPLAFVLIRLISSVFGDVMGVKPFFILGMAFQIITNVIYSFALLPIHFAIGKLSEGANEAFFWAVDRTAIIARAKESKYLAVIGMLRQFGGAFGIIGAGLAIAYFSFESVFLMLIALGLIGLGISLTLVNRGASLKHPDWTTLFRVKRKEMDFWDVSLATILVNVSFLLVFTFLLPVFMDKNMGMDYFEIAAVLTVFYISIGLGTLLAVRLDLDENKLLSFQLVSVPFLICLPYTGAYFVPALVIAGMGYGVCIGINEALIGYIAENGRGISSRIAVLIAPLNFATFLIFAVSGFIIDFFGIGVLFVFSGLLLTAFIVLGKKVADDLDSAKGIMAYHPHKEQEAQAQKQ